MICRYQVTNAISGMTAIGGLLLLDRSLLGAMGSSLEIP